MSILSTLFIDSIAVAPETRKGYPALKLDKPQTNCLKGKS